MINDDNIIFQVSNDGNAMKVEFNPKYSLQVGSLAVRLASLQLDNAIIGAGQKPTSPIVMPQSILERLK
jgi:hypothetical protein